MVQALLLSNAFHSSPLTHGVAIAVGRVLDVLEDVDQRIDDYRLHDVQLQRLRRARKRGVWARLDREIRFIRT
jgi:hypothetical protein